MAGTLIDLVNFMTIIVILCDVFFAEATHYPIIILDP